MSHSWRTYTGRSGAPAHSTSTSANVCGVSSSCVRRLVAWREFNKLGFRVESLPCIVLRKGTHRAVRFRYGKVTECQSCHRLRDSSSHTVYNLAHFRVSRRREGAPRPIFLPGCCFLLAENFKEGDIVSFDLFSKVREIYERKLAGTGRANLSAQ